MEKELKKLSHKEWRKVAKKMRRKSKRKKLALELLEKQKFLESTPGFKELLAKQEIIETIKLNEDKIESENNHKKWLMAEQEAQRIWKEEKRIESLAIEERKKETEKIRLEWEEKQKEIKKQKEEEERLLKEEEDRRTELLQRIDNYIVKGGDIPLELQINYETRPDQPLCQFFQKVGSCRFRNPCSRNHVHPSISNQLLFPGFFSHFSLIQTRKSEYDTDIGLEYEDSDLFNHFKEFFYDILPELESHGHVTFLRVCCNFEQHLRGNVYVEYSTEREALLVFKKFQGRWYGGKQLTVTFVKIPNWGAAICGEFIKKHCLKGKSCNFLHTFRNPKNEFPLYLSNSQNRSNRSESKERNGPRHWRWSNSPESERSVRSDESYHRKHKNSSRDDRKTSNGYRTKHFSSHSKHRTSKKYKRSRSRS